MNYILEAKELCKIYSTGKNNSQEILKKVDIAITQGEFISVMGPSGSGKSTLLYNVSGMDAASSGTVVFDGAEITALREKDLAAIRLTRMGFVFQQFNLLKNLSIFDNIILSAYMAKKESREEINARAWALMERTGIKDLADSDITQVSGGQLQRAAICRALISNPPIVFGDEPTGALNSKASREIMDIFAEINALGTTVMLVTHDVKVASRSERVLYMTDGVIAAEKHLGKFNKETSNEKSREEELSDWLMNQGF
ncbi:ABC transporter ATP-binding protein [Breznakiella homolactica]|uniref:ABC transporter ATP-binding protein n=1 Tax=Breznakiella homolactica TaxID=2798577 RepID=A0A7T8B7X2_9SPIR|nr:ABC transporter ATP-binding protein [Breznakiella homolactica]QQO07984.1 ABC transporter ATP-binding protein [Breznakiella homolactica]